MEELKARDGEFTHVRLGCRRMPRKDSEEARLAVRYRTPCILWVIAADLLDPECAVEPEA